MTYNVLEEKWKIPEKRIADILISFFSRLDDLLSLQTKILISIDNRLNRIENKLSRIERISSGGGAAAAIAEMSRYLKDLISQIKEMRQGIVTAITRPRPSKIISSDRIEVNSSNDSIYEISEETDTVMIINLSSSSIYYNFNNRTSPSSPEVPADSIIMIDIPKEYRRLFIRSKSSSGEVKIVEWKYV